MGRTNNNGGRIKMSKRRVTVDSDHLTLVVSKKLWSLASNYRLVAHHKTKGEETLLTSVNYFKHEDALEQAKVLGKQLNVRTVAE